MTYKKGDKFLVEITYMGQTECSYHHWVELDGCAKVVSGTFLEQAQKIEPEYEDGEWYMAKPAKDSPAEPWKFREGVWQSAYLGTFRTESMHWIGPKIERPGE